MRLCFDIRVDPKSSFVALRCLAQLVVFFFGFVSLGFARVWFGGKIKAIPKNLDSFLYVVVWPLSVMVRLKALQHTLKAGLEKERVAGAA